MNSLKKLIKFIYPEIKKYRYFIFSTMFFTISANILAIAIVPLFYQQLIDLVTTGNFSASEVYTYATYAVLAFTGATILFRAYEYASSYLYVEFAKKINTRIFSLFINKDYHFYQDNFSGSLVAKFSKFGRSVTGIYNDFFTTILGASVGIISVFVILFQKSVIISSIFLAWSVAYILLSFYWAKKMSKTSFERTTLFSKLTGQLSDSISNIEQVKSFGQINEEEKFFAQNNKVFAQAYLKDALTYDNGQTVTSLLNTIFQIVTVFLGAYLYLHEYITLGVLILLLLYIRVIMARVRHLGKVLPYIGSNLADTREVIEILETPVRVIDSGIKNEVNGNDIEFNNVSFTYPNGEHVFEGFNLKIPEGQKIGIVGKSGSGKTSIVKLLLRFYDPETGNVKVGNANIQDITQDFYRQNFLTFVPQDTTLFHRSLQENIMYGNPDASEELFSEVVKSSYVDEFADDLDEKYETKVGERGIRLSGGQRQRVGIARAMLKKDAPILIMDEATSALDSQSEQYIQESFEKLSEGRTTIVIAHRLSTIQKMDRIIVMEKGKIIEDGSHSELINKKGTYYDLWNSQVGGFITE